MNALAILNEINAEGFAKVNLMVNCPSFQDPRELL
jgi:hypothetical protein